MRPAPAPGPAAPVSASAGRAQWALLAGNFAIGCGVMVTTGTLNDLARGLQVGVGTAGQLITAAAVAMALAAPLLAAWLSGGDRRRQLTAALLWYAAGHLLCALMPGYASLLPVRAATVLGAALFTPQAAAAIGVMVPPERRGQAITFIFLGWSLASVLGVPLAAWLGEVSGWRSAFAGVGLLSLAAAAGVWRALPDGVRPQALSRAAWSRVAGSPVLLGMVAVTALTAAGQFTVFAYVAPYYRQVLGASPAQVSLLLMGFGLLGVVGNVALSRGIDRIGASRAVAAAVLAILLTMLVWPLGRGVASMMLVLTPWALGCFASNSAQQARLAQAAPLLTPALIALNTSAMYVGQALGAGAGGLLVAQQGFGALHQVAALWLVAALGLSAWVTRQQRRGAVAAGAAAWAGRRDG